MTTFKDMDIAEYLQTDEAILGFLGEAFSSRDPKHIAKAIGIAARAKTGMGRVAKETGLNRETLYKTFGDQSSGNPTLKTLISVLGSLNLDLTITPRHATA